MQTGIKMFLPITGKLHNLVKFCFQPSVVAFHLLFFWPKESTWTLLPQTYENSSCLPWMLLVMAHPRAEASPVGLPRTAGTETETHSSEWEKSLFFSSEESISALMFMEQVSLGAAEKKVPTSRRLQWKVFSKNNPYSWRARSLWKMTFGTN